MADQSSSDKKDRYHHGDLRTALIDAALEMVAERGLAGLSIRQIARQVGVTHSAPYRHFKAKDELLAAMAVVGFEHLHQKMERAVDEREEALDKIYACGLAYVNFAVRNPAKFRVMFSAYARQKEKSAELAEAYENGYSVLVDTIEECQRVGVIRSGSTEERAMAAWACVHGLASLFVNGIIDDDRPEKIREVVGHCARDLYAGLIDRDG